ncbi:MAG: tetratricopeptide repeat protein, partial [Balneolaceae bacterium]
MIWLLTLTMLLSQPEAEAQSKSQIATYFSNIEQGTSVSESVWALLAIAKDDTSQIRNIVEYGRGSGQQWVEHLVDAPNNRTAILRIAKALKDEYLHLYLQLLRLDENERIHYFEDFYSVVETDRFKELNRRLAYSKDITPGMLIKYKWDFSYLLVSEYNLNINFAESSENFYSILSDHLLDQIKVGQPSDNFQDQLYYFTLLRTLYSSQNYREIANHYEKFLNLNLIPDTVFKRDFYWRLDFAVYQSGQIARSLYIQREYTIPMSEKMGLQGSLNTILADHGASLYLLGKYQEAKQILQAALADTAYLDNSTRTRLLNNLGLTHYKLGETNRYIETQFLSLEFASEQNNYSHQQSIYRNLHIYYRKNRNWDLALEYINEAREIAELSDNNTELASIIISQAAYFHTFLDDLKRAELYLNEAERLLTDETDYRLQVRLLYERADLHKAAGRMGDSRKIYRKVARIGSENNNNPMYLEALIDLAEVELDLQNYESAGEFIREFNIHDITVVDFYVLVKARNLEAELAIRNDRLNEAENILKHVSAQVLEWAQNTTDPEGGYWHIEPAYMEMFQT